MPIALIGSIISLLEAGITVIPSVIAAGRTAYDLVAGGTNPTAAEQAAIDAALDSAHAALQAAKPTA